MSHTKKRELQNEKVLPTAGLEPTTSRSLDWRSNRRGETIRVHHDTIRITIQISRYDTYRDMLYTFTCTAEKWKNILIFGSPNLQLEINLWNMHYYTYGTTNNEFLHRKYCEQSKLLVLNHFCYPLNLLKYLIWKPTNRTPAVSLCVSFGSVYHDTYREPYVLRYIVKRYIVAPLWTNRLCCQDLWLYWFIGKSYAHTLL